MNLGAINWEGTSALLSKQSKKMQSLGCSCCSNCSGSCCSVEARRGAVIGAILEAAARAATYFAASPTCSLRPCNHKMHTLCSRQMELAGSAAAALAAEAVLEVAARLTIRSAVYAAIMMIFLRDFGVNRHGNI